MTAKGKPWGTTQGQGDERAASNNRNSSCYSTTVAAPAQEGLEGQKAPSGAARPVMRGDMIYIEGRHVARVSGGALLRTFDRGRETLFGRLYFRRDVLELARQAGAAAVIVTERESGLRYKATLARWLASEYTLDHKVFGYQLGLPLDRLGAVAEAGEAVQLDLFGGRG